MTEENLSDVLTQALRVRDDDVTDPEVILQQYSCRSSSADIRSEGDRKSSSVFVVVFFLLFCCCFLSSLRRHHERDARGEAVRLEDDREQRARDEGAAHGPRDGETLTAGPAA